MGPHHPHQTQQLVFAHQTNYNSDTTTQRRFDHPPAHSHQAQFERSHFESTHFSPIPNQLRPNQFQLTSQQSLLPCHQPQPQAGLVPVVRILENEVETSSQQHQSPQIQASKTDHNSQLTQSQSKKRQAKKTSASAVDSTQKLIDGFLSKDVFPGLTFNLEGPTAEDLMNKKSLTQLRISAEEVGKANLSEDDEIFFLNLHDNIMKSLAINCLYRGVKLSAVERYLGHKKPFRDATRWHGFLQDPESRKVFSDYGGVKDGQATTLLKERYRELTEEEKNTYKPKSKLETLLDHPAHPSTPSQQVNGTVSSNLGSEAGVNSIGDEGPVSSSMSVCSKSRSFATDQGKVIRWLREANIQLHRLGATYHLEGFIILVSTHVSYGSLQLFRGTEGAVKWHEATKRLKPHDNCLANLQAYVLGKNSGLGLEDSSGNLKSKSDKAKAREKLGKCLGEFTNQKHKIWPWKNCESTLKSWGYRVSLSPGASSEIEWITGQRGSNALTSLQARLILKDLSCDLIQLSCHVAEPLSLDCSLKPPPKKRPRTEEISSSPEGQEEFVEDSDDL